MFFFFSRRLPLAPDKNQGGYAQIFAKNREKKSKDSKQTYSKQQAKQPVKALNAHVQSGAKQNDNSYSSRNHQQTGYNHPNKSQKSNNYQPMIANHTGNPHQSAFSHQSAGSHQSAVHPTGSNNQQTLYYQQHSFQPTTGSGQYVYYGNGRQYSGSSQNTANQYYQAKPNR